MSQHLAENRIRLSIDAIRSTPRLSFRRAADMYDIPNVYDCRQNEGPRREVRQQQRPFEPDENRGGGDCLIHIGSGFARIFAPDR
jgi:hypothetical protein